MRKPVVYILASERNGTLYVGVTSDLLQRIAQHKKGTFEGFSLKYGCDQLVFYEFFETMVDVITQEKKLKKTSRIAKMKLIESLNPEWIDLSEHFNQELNTRL